MSVRVDLNPFGLNTDSHKAAFGAVCFLDIKKHRVIFAAAVSAVQVSLAPGIPNANVGPLN